MQDRPLRHLSGGPALYFGLLLSVRFATLNGIPQAMRTALGTMEYGSPFACPYDATTELYSCSVDLPRDYMVIPSHLKCESSWMICSPNALDSTHNDLAG